MNERIKKLISECTYIVTDYSMRIDNSVEEFDKEKFAELIVKECSNFLKDTLDDHFAAEQLEEHFGVEE